MVNILDKLGLASDVAADGQQALDMVMANQDYDYIFMDLQMPVMDGLECTGRVREQLAGRSQPAIIAMTANVMEGIQLRCIEAGMNDYISKPVKISSVKQALLRHSPDHFPMQPGKEQINEA